MMVRFILIILAIVGFAPTAALPMDARGTNRADSQMVSAANPHAARAGLEILRKGGSAADAVVAMQAVLTLVEPQSSGIGGGAFLIYYDAASRKLIAYDGRETAPAGIEPDIFLNDRGQPIGYYDAIVSGTSVGVPGVVAMLEMAQQAHGRLAWADLFDNAIELAENGFAVSPRLHEMIGYLPKLPRIPASRAYFFEPGDPPSPLPVGTILRNPEYAETLRKIATEGAKAFYSGKLARSIVSAVRQAPERPGSMTLSDLKHYQAKTRDTLCRPYRTYLVCGMPPPTSGGLTLLQILGILSHFDMGATKPNSIEAIHILSEASRLAFADRDRYIGDPDYVDVPVDGMLDPVYLAGRAALIDRDTSLGPVPVAPGTPPGVLQDDGASNVPADVPSTSHFTAVDRFGNAASITSSVEAPFGSHLMAAGFMLNNQLTDFSFVPVINGRDVANAVAPGKRPRSSMTPTMIFDAKGDLFATIGSPGGSRIIGYVAQTVVALIDWRMDMQSAIDLPRVLNRNGPVEIEAGTALEELAPALEAKGHEVKIGPLTSGLHGIRVTGKRLEGGADPRREGVAIGD